MKCPKCEKILKQVEYTSEMVDSFRIDSVSPETIIRLPKAIYCCIEKSGNPFKAHWQAFLNKELTLEELEKVCFTWIIIHEELYQEKPLPTEPEDTGKLSAVKFLDIKKAWKYYYEKIELENKSNAETLKDARNFFLNNDYDEGLKLFNKYANYQEKPNDELRNQLIEEMSLATKRNVEKANKCPF